MIAVRYILSQEGDDGKCYPNRFGSIGLSDVESRYSQAKLEVTDCFVPYEQFTFSTPTPIAWRAHQLQKCREDIDTICKQVLLSQFASLKHFEQQFKNQIRQEDFSPGDLILVHNSRIEKELNRKTKPHYLGPMVVLRRTTGGSYLLAELDSSISRL